MIRHIRSQHGFTLFEMIITIVILAIALVGVASMVGLGTSNSADTLLQTRAIALGQSYLDEIVGRRYDERSAASGLDPCFGLVGADRCSAVSSFGHSPGDSGEATRDKFDDVDDYHNLAEGYGEADPITEADGVTARPEYENFHISVTVRYAGDDAVLGLDATDAKLITVTVTYRTLSEGWEFSVYRGNY